MDIGRVCLRPPDVLPRRPPIALRGSRSLCRGGARVHDDAGVAGAGAAAPGRYCCGAAAPGALRSGGRCRDRESAALSRGHQRALAARPRSGLRAGRRLDRQGHRDGDPRAAGRQSAVPATAGLAHRLDPAVDGVRPSRSSRVRAGHVGARACRLQQTGGVSRSGRPRRRARPHRPDGAQGRSALTCPRLIRPPVLDYSGLCRWAAGAAGCPCGTDSGPEGGRRHRWRSHGGGGAPQRSPARRLAGDEKSVHVLPERSRSTAPVVSRRGTDACRSPGACRRGGTVLGAAADAAGQRTSRCGRTSHLTHLGTVW